MIRSMPLLPSWLPAVEAFKPVAQGVAVTAGVFLGWRLNGWSQSRERRRQARAEWAGAAEGYLSAYEADYAANERLRGNSRSSEAYAATLTFRQSARRELEEATGKLRATTVRLLLVGRNSTKKVDVIGVEREILEFRGTTMDEDTPTRIQTARNSVRNAVTTWLGD
jgi:hypothetical protein